MSGPCFIYAILAMDTARNTFFKVGISNDPEQRLKAIQTSCPLRCSIHRSIECVSREAAKAFEAFLHDRLRDMRATGEWFHIDSAEDYEFFLDELDATSRVVATPTWREALYG